MTTVHALVDSVDDLIAALEGQNSRLTRLRELSEHQTQFIADHKAEPLLSLLAHRQKLIDEIQSLNERIAPFRAHWDELWTALEPSTRQRVQTLVKEVETQLANLIEQDGRDRQALQAARQEVGDAIGKSRHVGQALHAYRNVVGGGSRAIAREG